MKVRWRLNTRVRKMPTGFVTKNTHARNRKIWNQPFAVISEFLRAQERVDQINRRQHTHRQHNHGFQAHCIVLKYVEWAIHFIRSQKCTYAIDIAKNVIVTAIQRMSCIASSINKGWNADELAFSSPLANRYCRYDEAGPARSSEW